jgi:uncharacterized iron-regulated membrane protein
VQRLPLSAVVSAAAPEADGWRLSGVLGPRDDRAVWDVYFDRPARTPGAAIIREVLVDPVNGRVHGHRDYDPDQWLPPTFVGAIFALHDTLLIPWQGDAIVGALAVVLLVSVLTGLIVWWPLGGSALRALRPRRRLRGARLHLELHRLSGAWSALVLVAVLVSGISMNLHETFVWLVRRFSPQAAAPPPALSSPASGREPLGLAAMAERARAASPAGRLHSCVAPVSPGGTFSVTFHEVPAASHFWSERVLTLDAFSGAVLDVRDASNRRTGGDAFLDWQWPLHSGKAFGWPGRIAVFLTGLACPLLFVTGLLRWRRKRLNRGIPRSGS